MVLRNNIDDLLHNLEESRFERGRGSSAGREKMKSGKKKFNPEKAKVRVYPSIRKAIQHGKYGDIFSTDTADRLYVVTKPTWGDKSTQGGSKVAKGFTPGSATPKANWKSIQGYSKRTKQKHGGVNTSEGFTTGAGSYHTGERIGAAAKQGTLHGDVPTRVKNLRRKIAHRYPTSSKGRQKRRSSEFTRGFKSTSEAFSLDKDKSPYERGIQVQDKSGWTVGQGMNLKKLDPRIARIRKKVINRHKTRQSLAAHYFDSGMHQGDYNNRFLNWRKRGMRQDDKKGIGYRS